MSRWQKVCLFLVFLFLSANLSRADEIPQSSSAPDVWTVRKAVDFALRNSPDSKISLSRVAAAQAAIAMEKSAFYPQLSIASSYSQTDNPMYSFGNILNQGAFAPTINFNDPGRTDDLNVGLQLGYRIYDGGRDAALRAAQKQESASRMDLGAVHARLAFEVVRACSLVMQADDMIKARQAAVEAISSSLAVAQARYDEGLLLKADLLDLEVQLSQSQENLIQAQNNRTVAGKVLENLLGLKDGSMTLDLKQDSAQEVPVSRTYENRFELRSLDAMINGAEARVRQARAGAYPTVDSYAGYSVDDGTITGGSGDSWQAGIRLNYNIFDGHRTSAAVSKAQALLDELHEQKPVENRLTAARVRRTVAEAAKRIAVAGLRHALGLPQFDEAGKAPANPPVATN
ncbi:MAG: TolC family protein [Deltaproteobacteria bacterium]